MCVCVCVSVCVCVFVQECIILVFAIFSNTYRYNSYLKYKLKKCHMGAIFHLKFLINKVTLSYDNTLFELLHFTYT